MKVRFKRIINHLRMSFWFVPSMIAIFAALLGYGMQKLDVELYGTLEWELTDSAGARAILTTIAASSITVAGVVFSITMVVLSSASTQYGPRLMRNFIRQPQSKWVLGGYIGIFIYCLMVIATIRQGEHGWVPQVSVTAGGVFGVLSFGLLIAFIHHVATFLQAARVINDVGRQLDKSLKVFYPLSALDKDWHEQLKPGSIPADLSEGEDLICNKQGYIQAISLNTLLEKTTKSNSVIRLYRKPGDYVIPGEKIATIWNSGEVWESVEKDVNLALMLASERTDDQDIEFCIHQLVEVAVRALSPGINDPFTAMNCINRIAGAMVVIDQSGLPGGLIHDKEGNLRIVAKSYTYEGLTNSAFNQIRQNSRGVEAVSIALIEALAQLYLVVTSKSLKSQLARHAKLLKQDVDENYKNKDDLEEFNQRYAVFTESG